MIDIRHRTAVLLKRDFGIEMDVTELLFDCGLLREDLARRYCVRDDFNGRARTRMKTELKIALAEKYSLSLSTVEKIISEGNCLNNKR